MEKLQQEFSESKSVWGKLEEYLRGEIDRLEEEGREDREKITWMKEERQRLLGIVEESVGTKEREVKLRVEFEAKINELHAVNRVLQQRLDRAMEDM
jgi:hypothetical protein